MNQEHELRNIIFAHLRKYPEMQVADLMKLLYQNEFGAEHMVTDEAESYRKIIEEVESLILR